MIGDLMKARTASGRFPTIVVTDRAWNIRGVASAFTGYSAVTPVISDDLKLDSILKTVPRHQLVAVVLDAGCKQGIEAIKWINDLVRPIRQLHPQCSIIFLASTNSSLNTTFLSPRTHVATSPRDVRALVETELVLMHERSWIWRNGPARSDPRTLAVTARTNHARSLARCSHPVPNFNIKHPSMLVPVALAAARTGLQLFCEISPREAFLFHGQMGAHRVREVLSKTFIALRNDIEEIGAAIGGDLRLHLDHADDLDIIRSACDAGFDSIMADGSALSVTQNILFTRSAIDLIRPYGCAIEGEIGSIDSEHASKWAHTNQRDFETFVSETDLDFVGISVGQFHGFDYGFTKTRGYIEHRADDIKAKTERRLHVMANALLAIESELAEIGLNSTSLERQQIRKWSRQLLRQESGQSIESFFETCSTEGNVRLIALADQVAEKYFEISLEHARACTNRWNSIVNYRQNVDRKAMSINHHLLQSCSRAISDTSIRLVIHGGSSLHWADLREFHHYNIARVNFGTTVFDHFLNALSTRVSKHIPHGTFPQTEFQLVMAFLDEVTADWRTWVDKPPEFLDPFVDWIVENLVEPLSAGQTTTDVSNAI